MGLDGSGSKVISLSDSGWVEYGGYWRGVCLLENSMANVRCLPSWSSDNLSWKEPEVNLVFSNFCSLRSQLLNALPLSSFSFVGNVEKSTCLAACSTTLEGWPLDRLLVEIPCCWHAIMGNQLIIWLEFSSWGNSMWVSILEERNTGQCYPTWRCLGITVLEGVTYSASISCQCVVGCHVARLLVMLFFPGTQRFTYNHKPIGGQKKVAWRIQATAVLLKTNVWLHFLFFHLISGKHTV